MLLYQPAADYMGMSCVLEIEKKIWIQNRRGAYIPLYLYIINKGRIKDDDGNPFQDTPRIPHLENVAEAI